MIMIISFIFDDIDYSIFTRGSFRKKNEREREMTTVYLHREVPDATRI